MSFHSPVLLRESIEGLNIRPGGNYIDVTFGGGGHSAAILERVGDGKLLAFDQDKAALSNAPVDDRLVMVHHNFRFLKRFLANGL